MNSNLSSIQSHTNPIVVTFSDSDPSIEDKTKIAFAAKKVLNFGENLVNFLFQKIKGRCVWIPLNVQDDHSPTIVYVKVNDIAKKLGISTTQINEQVRQQSIEGFIKERLSHLNQERQEKQELETVSSRIKALTNEINNLSRAAISKGGRADDSLSMLREEKEKLEVRQRELEEKYWDSMDPLINQWLQDKSFIKTSRQLFKPFLNSSASDQTKIENVHKHLKSLCKSYLGENQGMDNLTHLMAGALLALRQANPEQFDQIARQIQSIDDGNVPESAVNWFGNLKDLAEDLLAKRKSF